MVIHNWTRWGENQKTIDEYNATDPDFKVKLVSMQGDTFTSKLTTAGKSGKGVPDLALVASEALPTYKNQEMLDSWDDMIKGTELDRSNYVEAAWDTGTLWRTASMGFLPPWGRGSCITTKIW